MSDWTARFRGIKGEPLIPSKVTKYFKDQKPYTGTDQFFDDFFPPTLDSLLSTKCVWNQHHQQQVVTQGSFTFIRPTDFMGEDYLVFDQEVTQNDLEQGSLGDCYFLAALSAMTEFPGLIQQLFKLGGQRSKNGYYEILMFIDEEWQIVIVDDNFPALEGANLPQFVKNTRNVIWPLLLEKAWAKINDGYSNIIAGRSVWPFHILTGFPCSFIHFNKQSDLSALWEKLKFHDSKNHIMTCSAFKDGNGICSEHQYTLRFAGTVLDSNGNSHDLLCLRNPWGHYEWKGDWSDYSDKWTPGLRKQLGVENRDDGVFWISFNDFLNYFDSVEFAHSPNYFNDVCSFEHTDSFAKIYYVQVSSLSTLSFSVFDRNNGSDFLCSVFLIKNDQILEASIVHSKSQHSGRLYNLDIGEYHIVVYPHDNVEYHVKFSNNGEFKIHPSFKYDKNYDVISKFLSKGKIPEHYFKLIKDKPQVEKFIKSLKFNSSSVYETYSLDTTEFDESSPEFRNQGKINCINNMICIDDQSLEVKNKVESTIKQEKTLEIVEYPELPKIENIELVYENNLLIEKRQNFTMKYLVVEFPNREINNVSIMVVMRDQGWASSNCSGSWIELRIEDKDNNQVHVERLFQNIAVPKWTTYSVDIDQNHHLFKFMSSSYILNIYAMSAWSGWEIWVKKAKCVVS